MLTVDIIMVRYIGYILLSLSEVLIKKKLRRSRKNYYFIFITKTKYLQYCLVYLLKTVFTA